MFGKVYLIGVGLINGSLARGLKVRNLAEVVVGVGRSGQRLEGARTLGIVDEYCLLRDADVSDADLIVIGVPVGKTAEVLAAIRPSYRLDTLLTDVGSTKCSVIQAALEVFGELPPGFVPGHPIAGSELSGYEHAQENLFLDRKVILTPTGSTDAQALLRIRRMWQATGASVDELDAELHDRILSATSHLPHMVAYALVHYLGSRQDADHIFGYAAAGFYDFTRIASSSPDMWEDICMANRGELLASLDGFAGLLETLRIMIAEGDGPQLHDFLGQAKRLRDSNSAR